MTEAQQTELVAMVEGVVAGRLVDHRKWQMARRATPISREVIKRISHNVSRYLAGELKQEFSKG
jgi:hypothetical protein